MAEDKKAFVLYADLIHTVKKMPMDKRGELLTIILEYVNDEHPTTEDMIVDLVFEPIKRQMKRDLAKYEERAGRSRENGKKGGRPPNPKETQTIPKEPTGFSGNPDEPKEPDTVTATVTATDTGIDTVINRFDEFWNLFDKKKDRPKCEKAFKKLSQSEIELVFTQLPLYTKSTPDKQYRKNPLTWLNGKCWNDEIDPTSTSFKSNDKYPISLRTKSFDELSDGLR